MVTLAADLTALAGLATTNTGLTASNGDKFKLEDEVVEFARYQPGIRPDSSWEYATPADPTKIILRRGRDRTLAVPHEAGTTLVPASDAYGAGGGGVSVTDGTTTVAASSISFPPGMVSDSGGGSAAIAVALLSRTVVLTDAQIKALPTTPIELVPAPDPGQFIAPIAAWLYVDWHADYGNIGDAARIGIASSATLNPMLSEFTGTQPGNLLADGASHVAFTGLAGRIPPTPWVTVGRGQFQDEPGVLGAAVELYAANDGTPTGDFDGGDPANTISVTIWYGIVTP